MYSTPFPWSHCDRRSQGKRACPFFLRTTRQARSVACSCQAPFFKHTKNNFSVFYPFETVTHPLFNFVFAFTAVHTQLAWLTHCPFREAVYASTCIFFI